MNGLLLHAHGQNSILRFSRATGQLLGFCARDMSGTRFNRLHFERTTGISIVERMNKHDLSTTDLLRRAYFIFFCRSSRTSDNWARRSTLNIYRTHLCTVPAEAD